MTIMDIKKQIKLNVFTADMIKAILEQEYTQPVQKIESMVKNGELIRLKRGVYALSTDYRTHPINIIAAANMLLKPSYVSYEYALSYHGLIPERVYTVTSATTYRSYEYTTDIGNFSYTKIPLNAYPLGIEWHYTNTDGGFMIATPEKALCDKIYTDKRINAISQMEIIEYIEEDLRIDWRDVEKMDGTLIWKISMAYSSKILQTVAKIIKQRKKND